MKELPVKRKAVPTEDFPGFTKASDPVAVGLGEGTVTGQPVGRLVTVTLFTSVTKLPSRFSAMVNLRVIVEPALAIVFALGKSHSDFPVLVLAEFELLTVAVGFGLAATLSADKTNGRTSESATARFRFVMVARGIDMERMIARL